MSDLIVPKHCGDENEIKATLKIYRDADDWVENDVLKERLKQAIGEEQYKSSYLKKMQVPAYFGFVIWEDFQNDQSRRRITDSGKRFYDALINHDPAVLWNELMLALETITFGRNNYGASGSNSDIEAPSLIIRTMLILKYITRKELAYLLWAISEDGQNYSDVVSRIFNSRSGGNLDLPKIAEKYKDSKPIISLIDWGFLVETSEAPAKITINPVVLTRFERRLANLKIYNSDGSKEPHKYSVPLATSANNFLKKDTVPFEINKFIDCLNAAHLQIPPKLTARLVGALLTKPFVLLTGLSGSGKTKLAQAIALFFSNRSFVEKDAIQVGDELPGPLSKYKVLMVDRSSIHVQTEGKGMVCLSKGLIEEWVDKIIAHPEMPSGELKDIAKENTKYSLHEHAQHAPLMAAALWVLGKRRATEGTGEISNKERMNSLLVSVGADWTSREPLLGYPNALNHEEYIKPDNGVLDLLIDAGNDPNLPFFLILDEMNLSHVERYFADFLSAMESGDEQLGGEIYLHSCSQGLKALGGRMIPPVINLPRNLFILGTVNVDETTYMFSPKVLDRASVIEFCVTEDEMQEFLQNPVRPDLNLLAGEGAGMAGDFVGLAKTPRREFANADEIRSSLNRFFSELKKTGAEFGFRSASEIFRFAALLRLILPSATTDFIIDAAVMQKLLPKLHGSRRKLEGVLEALAFLCLKDEHVDSKKEEMKKRKKMDFIQKSEVRLELSFEKISRMYDRLAKDGFASFAEA